MILTIEIAPSDTQRLLQAFGEILGVTNEGGQPRAATEEEVQDATAKWLGGQTQDYERRANMKNFQPPPFESGVIH
jgi:hypothetical protein